IQGIPFYVDERVIVPRSFIGEILTGDISFAGIEDTDSVGSVLDLCTGSGCLAIIAARLFEKAQVDAVDLSADALEVAAVNVRDHRLEGRVHLHRGDLFAPVARKKYDLIITNPPYVRDAVVAAFPPEHRHEPVMAHAGGTDGMDLVRKIIRQSPTHLKPGGGLICEVGTGREILEAEFPGLPFLWLDTEHSSGEVFWLAAKDMR
nr:50S ribosomal protein L3 N(5)-glutamine methyltransferase [Pseudomonadota bacterium]